MQSLGTAEVAFGGLDRDVAKQELNLLQFAAGGAAEPSATSTEIVRCEFAHAGLCGEFLNNMPDKLFGDPSPRFPALLTRRNTLPA